MENKTLQITAKTVSELTRMAFNLLKSGTAKEINGATINKYGCFANAVLY